MGARRTSFKLNNIDVKACVSNKRNNAIKVDLKLYILVAIQWLMDMAIELSMVGTRRGDSGRHAVA